MAARCGATFELQRLHGMGESVYAQVLKNPLLTCRVYAPVGAHKDLLAYLVRRLLENGANSSFVRQLADPQHSLEDLLTSPLHLAPNGALPLPSAMLGAAAGRVNSEGEDFGQAVTRKLYAQALPPARQALLAPPQANALSALPTAMAHAQHAFAQWSEVDVQERCAALRRAADHMQRQSPALCALLVCEAQKTWADAQAEVREAIDFLRYYAAQAERIMQPVAMPGEGCGLTGETNTLQLCGRGVWVCISPWNFPLAIFVGQIAAALATGNAVLAKAAEQTPVIALHAVRILHAGGVPQQALQLLHGPGVALGTSMVALPGVAGVVFTGSMSVAKSIQRALAAKDGPIVPLIAETGGINAMIVDSSALPEQVVDAVVSSAFRSAGQRCSALRLLCVHSDIADGVLEMLKGAAAELQVGDPADWATDVGPVIDASAAQRLRAHIARLSTRHRCLFGPATQQALAPEGLYIAPHAFEVAQVADADTEIFGPVLQVLRWQGDPLALVTQINALGYGLTLGVQTRIDSRAQAIATAAHVGNVYVNRNMTGAVVGVQAFGGEGFSGTGPKAGGPYYLQRFCAERSLTVNTAAAGGNAALLT